MRTRWSAVFALLGLGCGVQRIELAPTRGDVVVLDALPPGALARLQRVDEDEKSDPMLALSYPADASAIPANLAPLTFLFGSDDKPPMDMTKSPPAAFRAFELHVSGAGGDVRLYTTATHAALPLARWRTLLMQARHAQLTLTLRALTDADRVVSSQPLTLRVLGPTRSVRVAYWDDILGGAQSARLDGAASDAADASDYPLFQPRQSLSADGSSLAYAQDGALHVSVAGTALELDWAKTLHIDDPCWSPDGSALAFVLVPALAPSMMMPSMMMPDMMTPAPMPGPEMSKSSLLQSHAGSAADLGEPELLVSAAADELVRAPSYSPDGRFIAFERAKGKAGEGSLWLVSAAGGEAKPLASKLWKGAGVIPTWIPALDEDSYWLVFSQSKAPPDAKLPATQLQLWAVALSLAGTSTPETLGEPFWLPFQDVGASNQRALFVAP